MLPRCVLLLAAALATTACTADTDDTTAAAPSVQSTGTTADAARSTTSAAGATRGADAAPPGTAGGAQHCWAGRQVVISAEGEHLVVHDTGGEPSPAPVDTSRLDPAAYDRLVAALSAHARTVRVTVPSTDGPRPVLLEFHGYTSNAAQQTLYSRLWRLAGDAGYVVVAIDGREPGARRWELTSVNPDPAAMGTSDVAVVDAVVDLVLASFCGDPDQLHAAGMSNGSVFSAVYACASRHRISAVGSVAFTSGRAGCDDGRQIPTLAVHGTADLVVPYRGRAVPAIRAVLGWDLQPAEEAMAEKAALNGCDGAQDEAIGDDVVRRTWLGCEAETVFYRVEGGGHGWPSPVRAPNPLLDSTDTIDASELLVDFFGRN